MGNKKSTSNLLLAAFLGGMSVMAIEMVVSRLVAPYFGTSLVVWTFMLGLIMVALSIGYYYGGRLADRRPDEQLFYKIMLFTSIHLATIPLVTIPAARWLANTSEMYINFSGFSAGKLLLLFSLALALVVNLAIPFIALGTFIPYIVKLQAYQGKQIQVGRLTAQTFALSNLGSILGTFLPTLVTIPLIGSVKSMILFASLLLLVSIRGMQAWRFLMLLPVFWASSVLVGRMKSYPGLIFDQESIYNYIQVVEKKDGMRVLRLNEGYADHSRYKKDTYLFNAVWDYFLFPGLLNQGKEFLNIGFACGTTARSYAHFFPHAAIEGVEIDPAIVRAGEKYFGVLEIPRLKTITTDGRLYLTTCKKQYDNIMIDAYKQPYIPFHLTTREFFETVQQHLSRRGIVSINVGGIEPNSEILLMIENTMKAVFKHVYRLGMRGSFQHFVWATDYDFNLHTIPLSSIQEGLAPLFYDVLSRQHEKRFDPTIAVLEDDRAPVEIYTEKMAIDFINKL
jgi:spermidine synthase